jgi:prepilin-type N-terminal cleavage/methylation domain-containing protein
MRKSYPRGMTLIELLIVVAISALIMIALLSLYMTGQKYFFNQNSRADTIEESRMPMARISRDIRDASNVSDEKRTIGGTDYETGPYCLVLEVPSIDAAGLITSGIDYIIYAYDSENRTLLRIVDPTGGVRTSARRVLADNLINDATLGVPFKLRYFRENGTSEVTSKPYSDLPSVPTPIGAFIVEVELTAQGRSIQRGSQPFVETVRTQAKLRNKVIPVIPS